MEWAYKCDTNERFQRIHDGNLEEDKILEKFRDVIYRKYNETRNEYIK